jgi:hypothetical protein
MTNPLITDGRRARAPDERRPTPHAPINDEMSTTQRHGATHEDPPQDGAIPIRPGVAPEIELAPASVNIWTELHISQDVQETGKIVGQVIGAVSSVISWAGTVQTVLQMAGFLSPAPNPYDQLYERIQRDLKTLLTATLAGATEERLRDVAEQGAIARTAAQHANEYLLAGRPSDEFQVDRLALADVNSLQVMNVLSDRAWWQRTYDPSDAAVRGPRIPGPAVIGASDLWPVSEWAAKPQAGLIWDYRHILPVYLRALAARIVVLKARAADGNQFQQIAGNELRGYIEFLTQQHDAINGAIRAMPAPAPTPEGNFHPFVFKCGAVETYTGTHVWGGLHPMYVDPNRPLETYEEHVEVWDGVVADCRRRLYEGVGLQALRQVIWGVEDLLLPPCGVSTAVTTSSSAALIQCVGVEPAAHVAVISTDGALHIAWKPSSQHGWQWHNAGRPPGELDRKTWPEHPVVVGYGQGNGRRIYMFSKGSKKRLYTYYWNGSRWSWADQGRPGDALSTNVTATTFEQHGQQHLRVFAIGDDGIEANWWDGGKWQWVHLGKPGNGHPIIAAPAVVTYRYQGRQLDDLYAVLGDGALHEHVWYEDGSRSWSRPSAQPQHPSLGGSPAVVTYEEDGQPIVVIFAVGNVGLLYALEWRNGWQWREHGAPPGTSIVYGKATQPVKAGALRLPDGQLWVIAVVVTWDGRVFARSSVKGGATAAQGNWHWQDLRTPPGTTATEILGVNSYVKGGKYVGLDIFVRSDDERIWRTGISWDNTWDSLGVPA